MKSINKYIILAFSLIILSSCVYEFEAEGSAGGGVLVVEGDIIIGDQSQFSLSESLPRNIQEEVLSLQATSVVIECDDGSSYQAVEKVINDPDFVDGKKYVYTVNTVDMNPDQKYKLAVTIPRMNDKQLQTKTYATDFLTVYKSPEIDSVYYSLSDDKIVSMKIDTHSDDPAVKNFKWRYMEDWEVRAHQYCAYFYDTDSNVIRKMGNFSEENTYYCWNKYYSTEILVANTDNLSANVISGHRLKQIYKNDLRISQLYAMEVYQQAISDASYKYWQNVLKNNDNLGGIFSPQPNEMRGNIYCIEDPSENVLGYIDAGTITRYRAWINGKDLRIYDMGKHKCERQLENDPEMWPWMYTKGLTVGYYDEMTGECAWYPYSCVDCRFFATKNRPDYFPAY